MRRKLPFGIYRTAVDIQGLFATGTGRAPSAVGQPEQVLRKLIMKEYWLLCNSVFSLMVFLCRKRRRLKKQKRFKLRIVRRVG